MCYIFKQVACGRRRQEECDQQDQPDQDWEQEYQEGEEQLFRTKGLAKQGKQGLLMSASEPEGLAVGIKCAPALHGNLAGFGGGLQGEAKGGNVREDQQQPSDVLWDGGGGAEGQFQGSVHTAEVGSRITRVTLTVPVYKTSFQGLSVRGIKVEDQGSRVHVVVEDQDNKEFKPVKKVARQWDVNEVESFCCYEVIYIRENYRVLRKALSSLNFSLGDVAHMHRAQPMSARVLAAREAAWAEGG